MDHLIMEDFVGDDFDFSSSDDDDDETQVSETDDEDDDNLMEDEDEMFFRLLNAIREREPLSQVKFLVSQHPRIVQTVDDDGITLLHFACFLQATAPVVSFLIEEFPQAVNTVADRYQLTPLHFACARQAPLDVIQVLLQANPDMIRQHDIQQATPLHFACSSKASVEVIEYLAQRWPVALLMHDQEGRCPLQVLIQERRQRQIRAVAAASTTITSHVPRSDDGAKSTSVVPSRRPCAQCALHGSACHQAMNDGLIQTLTRLTWNACTALMDASQHCKSVLPKSVQAHVARVVQHYSSCFRAAPRRRISILLFVQSLLQHDELQKVLHEQPPSKLTEDKQLMEDKQTESTRDKETEPVTAADVCNESPNKSDSSAPVGGSSKECHSTQPKQDLRTEREVSHQILALLRMNHAGRKQALRATGDKSHSLNVLSSLLAGNDSQRETPKEDDSLDAAWLFLVENPSICHRNSSTPLTKQRPSSSLQKQCVEEAAAAYRKRSREESSSIWSFAATKPSPSLITFLKRLLYHNINPFRSDDAAIAAAAAAVAAASQAQHAAPAVDESFEQSRKRQRIA